LLIQEAKSSLRDKPYLYLSALAVSGGAVAVSGLREILGPEPGQLLWDFQRNLAEDTVLRAGEAWLRLADDTSLTGKKQRLKCW